MEVFKKLQLMIHVLLVKGMRVLTARCYSNSCLVVCFQLLIFFVAVVCLIFFLLVLNTRGLCLAHIILFLCLGI